MSIKKIVLAISSLVLADLGIQGIFQIRILEHLLINVPFLFTFIQSCCLFCALVLLLMIFEKQ